MARSQIDLAKDDIALFREKASELRQSRFLEVAKREGIGVNIHSGEAGSTVSRFGPDDHDVKALILTLRFFVQPNERISLPNMLKLYGRLGLPAALQQRAADRYATHTAAMGRMPGVHIFGSGIDSMQDAFDIFVYGHHAHANKPKKLVHDKLKADDELYALARLGFIHAVLELANTIFWFDHFNNEVLAALPSAFRTARGRRAARARPPAGRSAR